MYFIERANLRFMQSNLATRTEKCLPETSSWPLTLSHKHDAKKTLPLLHPLCNCQETEKMRKIRCVVLDSRPVVRWLGGSVAQLLVARTINRLAAIKITARICS